MEALYAKTIIYKLVCKDISVTDFYVGHTTNFHERMRTHRSRSNNWDYPLYEKIREHGGIENWSMIEIIKAPCNNKREAEKIEREYMELLKPTLCQTRPFITEEERIIKKKECYKNWRPSYYENNKEKILQSQAKHRVEIKHLRYAITDCPCGGKYMYQNKSSHFNTIKHKNYIITSK